MRVKDGGHDVPELVVHRRFEKSLSNFSRLYRPLVDSWALYDNSGDNPQMIVFEESGRLKILDPDLFNIIMKDKEK